MKVFGSKFLFCFGLLLISLSCTKNVPGPTGEPGKDGANGNSNIYHSTAFTVRATTWDSVDTGQEIIWHSKAYIPEISSIVLRNGDIKVYTAVAGDWCVLPFYEGLLVTQCKFSEGLVDFYHSNIHGATPTRPADRNYRVVVVAPK